MVQFDRLHISWEALGHIWERHRLEAAEVREAFEDAGRQRAIFRGPTSRDGGRTYIARGRTSSGRPLWILVRSRGRGMASLITAREDR
jgi:hypothetical protein